MNENTPVPGPHYSALIELLRTSEGLWNASRVFFAGWDLSPSQFNILNILQGKPEGSSQTELSRDLIMHRSNITGLVDRLELRGLVRREDHPTDRRLFCIKLTPAGKKLMQQILPHYYQAAETVWGNIPPKRANQLVTELQIVSHNAESLAKSPYGRPT